MASADNSQTYSFDSSQQSQFLSLPNSSHASRHNLDPTPSLCSDTGEPVEDERVPPTPPSTHEVALVPLLEPRVPNALQDTLSHTIPSRIPTRLKSVIPRLQKKERDNTVTPNTSTAIASRSMANPVLAQLSPQKPKPPNRARKTPAKALSGQMHFYNDQIDAGMPTESLQVHIGKRDTRFTHCSGPSAGNVGSLEAELRRIARREVEAEYEREIHDLADQEDSVLAAVGQVSSRDAGFMAGGGAGLPVWIGNVDEAFNSDGSEKSEVTGGHTAGQSSYYIS